MAASCSIGEASGGGDTPTSSEEDLDRGKAGGGSMPAALDRDEAGGGGMPADLDRGEARGGRRPAGVDKREAGGGSIPTLSPSGVVDLE